MKLDIAEALRPVLVDDPELQALFPGEVALYYRMARRDAPMPYMAWQLRLTEGELIGLNMGSLVLDIWDHNANAERALKIERQVRALLHYRQLQTAATHMVTLWFVDSNEVPTDAQNVWRNSLVFSVMAYDLRTAQAILGRADVMGSGS